MALKKCPYCAEEIQEEAMLCKHCKSNLAVAPQAASEPTPVSPPAQPQVQPIATPTPAPAAPVNSDDRRTPEFVMGLIGGILGFGGGFFALMFGGIGAAFGASGAETIGSLGVSAFFFSILGIVGSVIVRKHGKLGGLFMTAAALGGLISISLFFLLPFILLGIAGIMGLVKKNQAEISTKYILWIPVTVAIFALSFVIGFASKPTAGIGKDKIDTSKINKMGTDVAIGDLVYNVSGARWVNGIKGEYSSYTGTFLIVDLAVSNLGKEAATVDSSMLTLLDSTDAKYEASMEATRAIKSNADFFLTSLNPKTKLVGSVAFNIPKQIKMPRLKVTGGMFSSDAKLIELESSSAAKPKETTVQTKGNSDVRASTTPESPTTDADYLIIPGKSVGKTQLGERRENVEQILGKPDQEDTSINNYLLVTYTGKSSGDKMTIIYDQEVVDQINFTSKIYYTADGIGIDNYENQQHADKFTKWLMKRRFANTKYSFISGGLTFYGLNVDSARDDYPANIWGVVHKGVSPVNEILAIDGEPNGGWNLWDGKNIYE